jgi:hypothetical protein
MPTVTKVAQSTEYVDVPIMAEAADGSEADVLSDSVFMAFVAPGTTVDDTTPFHLASWEVIEGVQTARCLVGPDESFVPVAGAQYDVYVKIIDIPEEPVLAAYRIYFK